MVAMLAAGYLAPALLGLLAAVLLVAGRSVGLLWLLLLMLLALLLWVRNGYGFLVLLLCGAGVLAVTWYADGTGPVGGGVPHHLAAAPGRAEAARRAAGQRRRRGRTSDPDQLAELTRLPAPVWMVLLLLANLAGPRGRGQHAAPDVA